MASFTWTAPTITPRGRLAFASPSIALCRRILATADVEILTLFVQPVNLELSFPDFPHERNDLPEFEPSDLHCVSGAGNEAGMVTGSSTEASGTVYLIRTKTLVASGRMVTWKGDAIFDVGVNELESRLAALEIIVTAAVLALGGAAARQRVYDQSRRGP